MKIRKKLTRKNVLKTAFIIYALLSVYFTTRFIDSLLSSEYSAISHYLSLNDGWDITINEDRWQNISLDAFRFPPVSKGDTLTMERTFSADTEPNESSSNPGLSLISVLLKSIAPSFWIL